LENYVVEIEIIKFKPINKPFSNKIMNTSLPQGGQLTIPAPSGSNPPRKQSMPQNSLVDPASRREATGHKVKNLVTNHMAQYDHPGSS